MGWMDLARLPGVTAARVAATVTDAISGKPARGDDAPLRTDRVAITVPGVERPDAAWLRQALGDAIRAVDGVAWTAINAPLRRLVIGLRSPAPTGGQLRELVDRVQTHHPVPASDPNQAEMPDEGQLGRVVVALTADVAGLAFAVAGRMGRWIPGSAEAASLITVLDTQPRLRALVERSVGVGRADTMIAVANAVAQGLAQGVTNLGVDAALRVAQLAEAKARLATWRAAEGELFASPELATADPLVTERPRALPEGPIEQYAPRSAGLAATGAVTALAGGAGPRRAAAIALSTLPKAAGAGREMFVAWLGRAIALRGGHVMDRAALRRLDLVDTIVLDASALTTGRYVIADVVPLGGADPAQIQVLVHSMFDPESFRESVTQGGWWLGPVDRLGPRSEEAVDQWRRLRHSGAVAVLALARGDEPHALVAVGMEPMAGASAVVTTACQAKTELVFAGGRLPGCHVADAEDVPGGDRLLGSLRQLQGEGRVVLLVSHHRQALAGADCGIGVDRLDGTPAWGADIMIGTDLELAVLLIDAVGAAVTVSRRGVRLAEAASGIGAATAVAGHPGSAARRALLAVNGAAALSLAQGAWTASAVVRRPSPPPLETTPWHVLTVQKTLSALKTERRGLSDRRVSARRAPRTPVTEPPGPLRTLVDELNNPLTPILAGGAALSAAIGSVVDAGIIVGTGVVGAVAGVVQRALTERAVAGLIAGSAVTATVTRGGEVIQVPADQLVPGDVVTLSPGDVIPADCRLIETVALEMDESSLTGESLPVAKSVAPTAAATVAERTSMVYEGTVVAAGRAVAVVVATGIGTEAGRGLAESRDATKPSGVEARLARISHVTLPVALASGAAVIAAGLLRGRSARQTIGAGVGLAVASVPEGLPFLIGAAQLAAARRLSRLGALVREPRTIEALGRVNVLCFDKTGTLTQGRIRLAAVSDGTTSALVDALGERERGIVAAGLRATPEPAHGQPLPHLTDRAVRHGAKSLGVTAESDTIGWRQTRVLPFEPSRGYHAVVGVTEAGPLLCVKGAPEELLPRCVARRTNEGEARLDSRGRRRLRETLHDLTSQGYRVLAVAESRGVAPGELTGASVDRLTFLGFLALADPIRGSAGASLEEIHAAGAQIVMITGDHPKTAEAIADELGILNGHRVVTGADIDALEDEALTELVPRIAVVARVTPAHKVRVVRAFQRAGRVVAMTGDGANDAPAIRLADVGIALGGRGTPAARAAADLVVTDDRLETIIAALVEGRAMWRSVRQALAILVGGNLGEIGFTLLGSVVSGGSPLSARQLLLVNLLTDLVPALSIALRRPSATTAEELLAEGPETSLGAALNREVAIRAVATTAGATAGWLAARATGRERRARTIALAALVGSQLGQTVLLGGRSPQVIAAGAASAAALAAIIQTPGLSQFFGCTPLGPVGWGIAITSAAAASFASTPTLCLVEHVIRRQLAKDADLEADADLGKEPSA